MDLTHIDGIGVEAATTILDEVGPDLSRFPTEHHFVSWPKLCPRRPISGGKPLSKRGRKGTGANRIAAVLRMAATSLRRSQAALGAYYRRISRTKDGGIAVFATARKLACYVYRMLRFDRPYVDVGQAPTKSSSANDGSRRSTPPLPSSDSGLSRSPTTPPRPPRQGSFRLGEGKALPS